METMRLLFLLLTIWTTAAGSVCAQQPRTDNPLWARSPPPPPPPPPKAPTLATLDLTAPANYPQFIENLRNIFSEKDQKGKDVLACSMRKMSNTVPSPRYGYIDIKASGTVTVQLAIDRTNIYVMGYGDKKGPDDRAFFFEDEFNNGKDLFSDAKGNNRRRLKYTGSYGSIGDKRDEVGLGFDSFKTSIINIYGKEYGTTSFTNHQKKFFLIAIQMIAEATRFKYISQKIPTANSYESFTPDAKVMALENGWDTLSTAIYKKTEAATKKPIPITKCKFIQGTTTITLQDQWTFKSVEEIADVIGILKSKGSRLLMINDDNDDDNGLVEVSSS